MSSTPWEFRTTEGVVMVDSETIRVRSTPREFIAGQRARWRAGEGSARLKSAVRVVWMLGVVVVGLGYFFFTLYHVLDVGLTGVGIVAALSVVGGVGQLWSHYLRETTIPLSAVEHISLDETNRKLTIRYETSRVRKILLAPNAGRQRFTLPTDDHLREARETFQMRGISVEDVVERGDTAYRFVVEDGVYFCESCRRQVSPADSTCPSCEYALRVECG